jgi:hypothetical protein
MPYLPVNLKIFPDIPVTYSGGVLISSSHVTDSGSEADFFEIYSLN